MRRGFVFGKFMPLHRGHQLLIDTAFAGCDDLTIGVYDSTPLGEYPPMPVGLRLAWLSKLYPQAEQIVALEDPMAGQAESEDPKYAELYAEKLEHLGRFDRVYTSEPGYDEFAKALHAEHVLVDAARTLVPISGTQIREDIYEHRGFIDPQVYASLIPKVVLVGTESTGKSTLARRLAEEYRTLWTHEYGRELWESQGLQGSFADHLKMARRQHGREEAARRHARDYLFCDTNAWTTLQWSLLSYGHADARLYELVDATIDEYIWILCGNEFGWVQDGTRELRGEISQRFQDQQIADLEEREIPYIAVEGSITERLEMVRDRIARRSPLYARPLDSAARFP